MKRLKQIPWWGWALGAGFFGLQYGLYRLANFFASVLGTTAWAFCPKIPVIDDMIPIVPIFVVIYLYSFLFWICGPAAVSLTSKENNRRFVLGMLGAYLTGFLIFLFLPSYMSRSGEHLMEIASGGGVFRKMLRFVYGIDGGDLAYNLFPSYHCLISTYCYLGVRKQPEISKGFRVYSLVMVVLICVSTVVTKQHYIVDVVGGVGISLIWYNVINLVERHRKTA